MLDKIKMLIEHVHTLDDLKSITDNSFYLHELEIKVHILIFDKFY